MEMFYTALTPKRVMRARVHSDIGSGWKVGVTGRAMVCGGEGEECGKTCFLRSASSTIQYPLKRAYLVGTPCGLTFLGIH